MKKIMIVSKYRNTAEFYARQLKRIFASGLSISICVLDEKVFDPEFYPDLVLISTPSILGDAKKYLKISCEIIFAKCSFSQSGLDVIKSIPRGSKALLVNIAPEPVYETISLIYQLGYRDLDIYPYYPGYIVERNIEIAITPNEEHLVPNHIKEIYNIGDRVIDISSIIDISTILGLEDNVVNIKTGEKSTEIVPSSVGFESMMLKKYRLEGQFDAIIDYLSEGIIGISARGKINLLNEYAAHYLDLSKSAVLGGLIDEIWPELKMTEIFNSGSPNTQQVIRYKEIPFVVDIYPAKSKYGINSGICIFKSYTESEKIQHKLREQVMGKGHQANYTFLDIKGSSHKIMNSIEIAKRISKSDGSILIEGESGTGKELFAQAIHNYSYRCLGPFVAINCAALPEGLLESELFGYEEGAFTGAKKGGKLGLLELAHGGTLFLDEIGEMPVQLQARLLRVIQERKVMHIGGDYLIDIDLRLIAATNKNLKSMVDDGQFRQDLYYRLNVLYLEIPALRERIHDISDIADSIIKKIGANLTLDNAIIEQLMKYKWEGNIRELYNCIEYLKCYNKVEIELDDLPAYVLGNRLHENKSKNPLYDNAKIDMITSETIKLKILSILNDMYFKQQRIGRRQIHQIFLDEGYLISENQVRKNMSEMEACQLIRIQAGRAGTIITCEGKAYLEANTGINGTNDL